MTSSPDEEEEVDMLASSVESLDISWYVRGAYSVDEDESLAADDGGDRVV